MQNRAHNTPGETRLTLPIAPSTGGLPTCPPAVALEISDEPTLALKAELLKLMSIRGVEIIEFSYYAHEDNMNPDDQDICRIFARRSSDSPGVQDTLSVINDHEIEGAAADFVDSLVAVHKVTAPTQEEYGSVVLSCNSLEWRHTEVRIKTRRRNYRF